MEERYFAASNSKSGFLSYFGEIFSPEKLQRLYIIKGGPGTGKNMFMRAISDRAESRGMKVIKYYCSSDQHSLDGVLIDGRIAFVDGTPPHSFECIYPGALDNIIDLGAFWDSEALSAERWRIEKLGAEKSALYKRAYRYLASYHELSEAAREILIPIIDLKKLRSNIERNLRGIEKGEKFSASIVVCDSVGMEGRVYFETLMQRASRFIFIEDNYSAAHIYLSEVADLAARMKLSVTLSYDPVESDRLDGVLIDEAGVLFSSKKGEEFSAHKCLSMNSFFDKGLLQLSSARLKNALRLRSLMMDEALIAMRDIKNIHFAIEEIYKSKMDFKAKEIFTEKFIEKLF